MTNPSALRPLLAAVLLTASLTTTQAAQAADPGNTDFARATQSFRETLGTLVAADTSNPPGNEARAVALIAKRLKAEGIAYEITSFAKGRENIVARLNGSGEKKPLLLLAHIDVVGADKQNWSSPAHQLVEKDGFLYGRGTNDDLGMAVINLETLILLKHSGIPLKRDVIAAFTGDEESGGTGVRSILEERPQLINAEYAINEGGGLVLDNNGKMQYLGLQAAEKIYQDFSITATGPTGHSSIPKDGNAIDRLARALIKVAAAQEPPRLIPITRAFFEASAALEEPGLADAMRKLARAKGSLPKNALAIVAKKPELIAMLRTTCIPTLIEGGTRANALPAKATANLNCRILPDSTPDQARARLISAIGDAGIEVQNKDEDGIEGTPAPSSMTGEFMDAVRRVTSTSYPGLPVIPSLVSGATDSRFLRAKGIQAYGLSPLASSLEDASRDHGVDERIRVSSIRPGIEYMYKLVSTIAR